MLKRIRQLLGIEKRHTYDAGEELLNKMPSIGGGTLTGVNVSESSAMTYSAVFGAVNLLSTAVANLPLILYKRKRDGSRTRASTHPVYRLLHDEPNSEQSSGMWRETSMGHALLWGNSYSEIERSDNGDVVALWPLHPSQVTPKRDKPGTRLFYEVRQGLGGEPKRLDPRFMLHIMAHTENGVEGVSPIRKARESIGLSLSAEKHGAAFFGNCGRPSGVLTHPGRLDSDKDPGVTKKLRDDWKRIYGGKQAGTIAVLEEGMKFEAITMPHDDAQFIETRQFQIEEVARWFQIPLFLLASMRESSVRANLEEQHRSFLTFSLASWLRRWTEEIGRKLLPDNHYAEFLTASLVRADLEARYKAHAVGRQWGWLSPNDIRRLENMDPIAGGDEYLSPLNMGPVGGSAAEKVGAN